MIKVILRELVEKPFQLLSSDDEYLPFSLKIGKFDFLPETLYTRNICGENFIEFRFDKYTRCLYEITLVAFQPNRILGLEDNSFKQVNKGIFSCMIEEDSELEISKPMKIFRSYGTLIIVWCENDLKYFHITENCAVGIDKDNGLSAVILTSLSEKQVEEIVGN